MVIYSGSISVVKYFRENILDGTVVFTLLFGSELFDDYTGHLAMATMASTEMTSNNDNPEKLQDRFKVRIDRGGRLFLLNCKAHGPRAHCICPCYVYVLWKGKQNGVDSGYFQTTFYTIYSALL